MEVRQNQLISDGKIGKLIWMEFNYIFCAEFWHINGNPPFCKNFVYNYQLFIQPQHSEIKIHKHHVNWGVYSRFFVFHQDDALVQKNLFGKHQPFQSAYNTFTKLNLNFCRRQSLINENPSFQYFSIMVSIFKTLSGSQFRLATNFSRNCGRSQ